MSETPNQQKSTNDETPLRTSFPVDDHEYEPIISAEQQDKVQENTSQHPFFRKPSGGLFRKNPNGTTHQVPNPEDGSAPRVLSLNSTSSTAETKISAVPIPKDGSQSVLALNGSTSSTTSTHIQLNTQTNTLAVVIDKSTGEKIAPDNSKVETKEVVPNNPNVRGRQSLKQRKLDRSLRLRLRLRYSMTSGGLFGQFQGSPMATTLQHCSEANMSERADVSITIQEELKRIPAPEFGCSIFKIHNLLRNVNKKAYEPEIIAIGPYHRGKTDLSDMEKHKWQYLKLLLGQKIEKVATCVAVVKPLEEKARKCYAEPIDLSSDEFVQMMVLDGCFIIQLLRNFRAKKDSNLIDRTDPIFNLEWILNSLEHDLMLFENQLPFFILCKLCEIIELQDQELISLALDFFSDLLPGKGTARKSGNPQDNISHFLDLIHRKWSTSKLKPGKDVTSSTGVLDLIRSSTQLTKAGIKFEKIDEKDIFDIEFENGTLRIPTLIIEDRTESFLRNLVAYEQYCGDDQINIVTDYVTFLGCLIKSAEDVTKLCRRGIIHNFVGENEVICQMFNKLNVCIVGPSRNFHYDEIFRRVNMHCDGRMNHWMAIFWQNYFNSPWGVISIVAGSVLLLLTLIQTIFTILPGKQH